MLVLLILLCLVFSLKTTELKGSRIGIGLWLMTVLAYVALLQMYWMPVFWRALLYLCLALVGVVFLNRMYYKPLRQIGIDEQGAFLFERERCERLIFVRANSIQLIAKVEKKTGLWSQFLSITWPRYRVIYCDSLSAYQYQKLRSFAAQQILLHRSGEVKKRDSE
jgi:hypothetical protein